MPYAIFEDGSHQFRVREGDTITVDRRDGEPGSELVFDRVFLIAGDGARASASPPAGRQSRRQDCSRIPRQENRDPEVPPPQEHSPSQRPPPVLYFGADYQHRRASLMVVL